MITLKDGSLRRENEVEVVGYLKENNLAVVVDNDGKKSIKGSVIIDTDQANSYKLSFNCKETKNKDGKEIKNSDYENLSALLPENTVTIAGYLKNTPGATYDTAINCVSKVWSYGKLEEYSYFKGGKEFSRVQLKGNSLGFTNSKKEFTPEATFRCDFFVEDIYEEAINKVKTGRVIIEGLIPTYPESVSKISFIAEAGNIAELVLNTFNAQDTIFLKGKLVRTCIITKKTAEISEDSFGEPEKEKTETTFVSEQVITGGSKKVYHDGEDGAIAVADVQKWSQNRIERMNKAAEKAKKADKVEKATVSQPDPDMDF